MIKKLLLSSLVSAAILSSASASDKKGVYVSLGSDTVSVEASASAGGNSYNSSESDSKFAFGLGGDYIFALPNKILVGAGAEMAFHENVKFLSLDGKVGYDVTKNIDVYGILGYGYIMPNEGDLESAGGFGFGLGLDYTLPSSSMPLVIGGEFKKYYNAELYNKNNLKVEADYSRFSVKVKYLF